jgi:hypothetical protein
MSYQPSLETYNRVDADVITFETSSSGGADLEAIGKTITDKKIAIGVIDHHTLQVESPDEVAAQIHAALKYIAPERLVISSDCGMGREGMSAAMPSTKWFHSCSAPTLCARNWGSPNPNAWLPMRTIRLLCRLNRIGPSELTKTLNLVKACS